MPNHQIKRIFLDTNIILSAAFYPNIQAARFREFSGKVKFVTSQRVIAECSNVIVRYAKNTPYCQGLIRQYAVFLQSLACEIVDDSFPRDVKDSRENDTYILETAISKGCDALCTYNLPDFANGKIDVVTPSEALRRISDVLDARNYIHGSILGKNGSILVVAELKHPGAFKVILTSPCGTTVLTGADGAIIVQGPDAKMSKVRDRIPANRKVLLSFRYNDTDFHADLWQGQGQNWSRERLASAQCSFLERTTTPLLRGDNLRGVVLWQSFSAIPRYVRDRQMIGCLSQQSLFATFDSQDIGRFVELVKTKSPLITWVPLI